MRLVKPSVEFLWQTPVPLGAIEQAGRTCYKSEDKITSNSAGKFAQMLLDKGHEAVIEHASMSMRFICDRGVTHEIVRHRLFSYAQESTRYCNYKDEVTFIIPCWFDCNKDLDISGYKYDGSNEHLWVNAMLAAELAYQNMIAPDQQCRSRIVPWTPQQARSVLPNSLKTEIVVTGNMREWRHFFKMRCHKTAHPQMREVAIMALRLAQAHCAVLFDEFDELLK